MAGLAAGADPGLGGRIDDDVAAFRAVAVGALDVDVADDDPAAHAGAEREQHERRRATGRADPKLTVAGGVGVVGERHPAATMRRHAVTQRKIIPARQVARPDNLSGGDVERPGRAQAHSGDVSRGNPRERRQRMHHAAHPGGRVLRPPRRVRWLGMKRDQPALVVDERGLDAGASEIDARIQWLRRLGQRPEIAVGAHHSGRRLVSTVGVGPVQAFINSIKSALSSAVSLSGRILSLRCGLGWPPLSYHSTTSSSVATEPSCM